MSRDRLSIVLTEIFPSDIIKKINCIINNSNYKLFFTKGDIIE